MWPDETYSIGRRKLLHRAGLVGATSLPLLSGCIEEAEEEHPNRGEILSITQTGRQNTFGPRSRRYWMTVPFHSEIRHIFEMKSSTEGYADPGLLNLKIYERPSPDYRAGHARPGYSEGWDVVKTIEGIDIESNPEFAHKLHPGFYSVELDGSELGREVELDWVARVHQYLGDGSNIDCPEQTEELKINNLYAIESGRTTDPHVELIHNIQYFDTASDTYQLDLLLQTPTDEDRVRIHNESGFCTTPFVGSSDFRIEHPESDPYQLEVELIDDDTVVASQTIEFG